MQVLLIISGGRENRQRRPPKDHSIPEVLILWSNVSSPGGQRGLEPFKFNPFGERALFTAAKELP